MNVRSSNGSTSRLINNPCGILAGLMAEERPITIDEACALRYLLFGSLKKSFSNAWTEQSFHFRSVPPYGFIQKKAGPCGVLAAVQAHVICELLYGVSRINADSGIVKLTLSEKREALARAMTSILWQAGENKRAIVAKKHNRIVLNSSAVSDILEPDGILEYLQLIYFECKSCLLEYYINFIPEV
ncbi:probable ubiquitin carboxyl-terminal hydrolase MINDY-4 isoform X1 [Argiope bruennichi]|uniref:probable ubiquitin carboxyl-terminal hydrolase MINDY-4 isoform X1 n=1 Tax=Argiope bruennichi TaxID=94029 RepID=UPI002494F2DE|nr:probable ubiquitin carboxyl-terminal hydrolase MINDY-4 isoform X1 [Argiope bruennichi]